MGGDEKGRKGLQNLHLSSVKVNANAVAEHEASRPVCMQAGIRGSWGGGGLRCMCLRLCVFRFLNSFGRGQVKDVCGRVKRHRYMIRPPK